MISIFDAILLLLLFGFVFYGLFKGLIKMISDIASVIIGAWVASHYYLPFAGWLGQFNIGGEGFLKVIAFILLFAIVSKLIGLLFQLINKLFKIISIVPFVKGINKIIGGILGFILGGLVLGLIIYVISKYSIGSMFGGWLETSVIAPFLLNFAKFLMPLFPEALKIIKGAI